MTIEEARKIARQYIDLGGSTYTATEAASETLAAALKILLSGLDNKYGEIDAAVELALQDAEGDH